MTVCDLPMRSARDNEESERYVEAVPSVKHLNQLTRWMYMGKSNVPNGWHATASWHPTPKTKLRSGLV